MTVSVEVVLGESAAPEHAAHSLQRLADQRAVKLIMRGEDYEAHLRERAGVEEHPFSDRVLVPDVVLVSGELAAHPSEYVDLLRGLGAELVVADRGGADVGRCPPTSGDAPHRGARSQAE